MTQIKIPSNQIEQWLTDYNNGASFAAIGRKSEWSQQTVARRLRKQPGFVQRERKQIEVTPQIMVKWTTLIVDQGRTYSEVARVYGCSVGAITRNTTIPAWIVKRNRRRKYREVSKRVLAMKRKRARGIRARIKKRLTIISASARRRARDTEVECDITMPKLLDMYDQQCGKCALTGIIFSADKPSTYHRNPYGPSVDRIVAGGAYTLVNVRLVLLAVNIALNEWGESVFPEIARAYLERQGINV